MVVLDFPATTAPSWAQPATVSCSSEVNSRWNVSNRPAVCPAFSYLGVIWGSSQACRSDRNCLVNAARPGLHTTAGSETVYMSDYETQLKTKGVRFPLWACHLQTHHLKSYRAPSHSVNSTSTKIRVTEKLQGNFVFQKRTMCAHFYADIFSASTSLTAWVCLGWARNCGCNGMEWSGVVPKPLKMLTKSSHW